MKISILAPDLSHNCLGRAYLLAKILQRQYEVEIIGPISDVGIWEPVANDKSIIYKPIKIQGKFKSWRQIREMTKKIDGDIIYVSKLFFKTYGTGLLKKILSGKPLVLDIDDWEMGFVKEDHKKFLIPYRILEKLTYFANEISVSNNFLQRRFGGTIVCHGRNTKTFNPEKFDGNLLREKYKIEKDKKVVMFFGTPRSNKGTDDLVKSISLIKNQDILLVIVGIDNDQQSQNLAELGKNILSNRFKIFGLQPFEKIPEFLAMSDIVVIPQRKNFATIGQTPAKVFDAMAMARPIIATDVGNLPEILEGCGWVVRSENPEKLAEKIQYVLTHPEEAKEMGQKAREKCIEKYSWDAMEKVLIAIFNRYDRKSS